jgi:CO dehydrogenase maturation factor
VRVAVAGKGGAGKTTISAALAMLAARGGRPTVAIDADANPNLGSALGMSSESWESMQPVPSSSVSRRLDGPRLRKPLSSVLEEHSAAGPDGMRLMLLGSPAHADEGCMCSAHAVLAALLDDLGTAPEQFVVVDMEASPEHLSRGTIRNVDTVMFVAEPYYRSLETVRRMSALASELGVPGVVVVANKLRSEEDHAAVAEFCDRHDLELAGAVPWSDAVLAADRERVPVVGSPAAAPVVAAVAELASTLQLPVHSPTGR